MKLMMESIPDATAFPEGDNLFEWVGTIKGASGTVYEGLSYKLNLKFHHDYPFSAPTVKFTTPCFHPNVDQFGNICLDILKEKWSAAYSIRTILISLASLLGGTTKKPVGCRPIVPCCGRTIFVLPHHHSVRIFIRPPFVSCRLLKSLEPNNESPLNGYAAGLWANQDGAYACSLQRHEPPFSSSPIFVGICTSVGLYS